MARCWAPSRTRDGQRRRTAGSDRAELRDQHGQRARRPVRPEHRLQRTRRRTASRQRPRRSASVASPRRAAAARSRSATGLRTPAGLRRGRGLPLDGAGVSGVGRVRRVLGDEHQALRRRDAGVRRQPAKCVECLSSATARARRRCATRRGRAASAASPTPTARRNAGLRSGFPDLPGLRRRQRMRRHDAGLRAVGRLRPVLVRQFGPVHGRDAGLQHRRGELRLVHLQRGVRRARRPICNDDDAHVPRLQRRQRVRRRRRRPARPRARAGSARRRTAPSAPAARPPVTRRREPACGAPRTRSAAATAPVCNTTTHACRACAGDGDCGGATPACQSTGACGQCSATNASACTGATPVCDAPIGDLCGLHRRTRSAAARRRCATVDTHVPGLRGRRRMRRRDAGLPAVGRVRPVLGDQRGPVHRHDAGVQHDGRELRRLHVERAVRRDDAGVQHDDAHVPRVRGRQRVRRRHAGLPAFGCVRCLLGHEHQRSARAARRPA